MRGVRSLLVLLVILAGLVGYIYFVESKKPETTGVGEPKAKVFEVVSDKIDEVRVKAASGDRTLLRKTGGAWQVVEPSAMKADEAEVSAITSGLASLEIQRVVDEKPSDLAQYGLAQPRVEVAFRTGGDAKTDQTVQLGDKTATGGDMYAKYGRPAQGLPHLRVPRVDLQQDDVRPARQGHPVVRAKQGRLDWDRRIRQHDPAHQGR